jgi:RNA polymerase sigma factor (sigma-70 family)
MYDRGALDLTRQTSAGSRRGGKAEPCSPRHPLLSSLRVIDPDTTAMGHQVGFQTTKWNLVQTARNVESLDALISIYWKPLYFFVRQHGYDNETSKDIVQDFLATLVERHSILKADPARGRFRTFLLTALANFLKDWAKAASRQKRGAGRPTLPLDFVQGETDYGLQAAKGDNPELVLNRAWARNLWERSLSELEGEPGHLEAFKLYLGGADYRTITERTGLSEGAATMAVRRLKARIKDIVIRHIRETVSSEEELAAEVAEFKSLLS